MMSGTTDRRAVWPFEPIDLGPDLTADVGPDTPPEEYPRVRARLFYRNRDLAAIEDEFGSLEAMERATAEAPAHVLPRLLWFGLRHHEEWSTFDKVEDLHGAAVWGVETQVAVARAMAKALGGDADDAERETRASLDPPADSDRGGLKVTGVLDDEDPDAGEDVDPPEAVAAG